MLRSCQGAEEELYGAVLLAPLNRSVSRREKAALFHLELYSGDTAGGNALRQSPDGSYHQAMLLFVVYGPLCNRESCRLVVRCNTLQVSGCRQMSAASTSTYAL